MKTVAPSILIADDHPVVRAGLRDIIEMRSEFHIIAECENGSDAIVLIKDLRPDIAILDIDMPYLSGIDVAAVVHLEKLPTRLIMLTISNSFEIFIQAMEYGVQGYVLKDSAVSDLKVAIRDVLAGKDYCSPSLLCHRNQLRQQNAGPAACHAGINGLTRMERMVLRFISEEKSSNEIAELLCISRRTVDSHREHIKRKLGLHGPHALLCYALQHKDFFTPST